MTGKLIITVDESKVGITGELKDANTLDRVAIVDSLMSAFDMKGEKRVFICDMLISVDKAKQLIAEGGIDAFFENFFKNLVEEKED